jgi:hypothetical protein
MLKKTITYTDYNGTERTEDFYFNLSKAEILELEMSTSGGFSEKLQRIISAKDTPTLVEIFKDLVLSAYGVKSPDGRKFIKNDEVRNDFKQTEAYSELFMELSTNAEKAAEFVNGIIPATVGNPNSTPAPLK